MDTIDFYRVVDNIQTGIRDDSTGEISWDELPELTERFVSCDEWDNIRSARNSVRGYNSKHAGYTGVSINKNNVDSIRELHNNRSYWDGRGFQEEITSGTRVERGSHEAVRCRLFVLPDDNIANESNSYEEYNIRCDLIGKTDRMSSLDFDIYKYKN